LTPANPRQDTSQKEVKQIVTLRFDEMISSPARLAILATLVPGLPICFADMKAATGLADGNLHVQTRKLADAGYLRIRKARHGARSVTEFHLTELGLERFQLHVLKLQEILNAGAGSSRRRRGSARADDSAVWA
jgi:DNA-binding transcriptional ArsR family regulator